MRSSEREEAGGWRLGECRGAVETTREEERGVGAASVKGHSVLQLNEQALRGTNKIVTTDPPLW